jgi:hypothetical protein
MLHSPEHATSSSSCSCPCPTCSVAAPHSSADHPLERAFPLGDRDPLTRDLERELVAPIGAEAEILEGRAYFDPPRSRCSCRGPVEHSWEGEFPEPPRTLEEMTITESELRALDGDR